MNIVDEIPARLAELVARVTATSTAAPDKQFHEVLAALRQWPDAEEITNLTFRVRAHQIAVGGIGQLKVESEKLSAVHELALVIAPEVVSCLPLGPTAGVLITRYRARPGERLVPVLRTQGPLQAAAVEQVRVDARKLTERGLTHPYVRGGVHWLMGSDSGTLLLDRWAVLRETEPGDRMLDEIEQFIKLRGVTSS